MTLFKQQKILKGMFERAKKAWREHLQITKALGKYVSNQTKLGKVKHDIKG